MGDMADYYRELFENQPFDEEYEPGPQAQCKFCGRRGLHWVVKSDRSYRLYDEDDRPHTCEEFAQALHANRERMKARAFDDFLKEVPDA